MKMNGKHATSCICAKQISNTFSIINKFKIEDRYILVDDK